MPARASKKQAKPPDSPANAAPPLPDATARALRRDLLRWYRRDHRKLPWRPAPGARPDAYHVLVSEAMLQQTQVATVIPYFRRFLDAFPTLQALADADEQAVLTCWQGLGYYRRARNLHAAAQRCVAHHAGRVPDSVEALLELPGVGRYTAGAIASIAFGRPAPILDGNVARVLARWFAIDQPIDQTATRRRFWAMAEALVPRTNPGDFNQAMMELGAMICTPREPRCMFCPVRQRCAAFAEGRVAELPVVGQRRKPQSVTHHVVAVERDGLFLFEQRPEKGLWSAMWQCPTEESPTRTDALPLWVAERFGLKVKPPASIGSFTHQTTHRTITFDVHHAMVTGGWLRPKSGIWRRLNALDDLPLPNPQRRVVAMLRQMLDSR